MKKPTLFILSLLGFLTLTSCGGNATPTTSEQPSVEESTTIIEETTTPTPESTSDDDPIVESHTIKQYLTNPGFDGKLGDEGPANKFVTWFNTITLSDVLANVVSLDKKTETKTVADDKGEKIKYITLGSGSSGAELTFNFAHDIKHFGLIVRAWYKYDDYGKAWHNDMDVNLEILTGETSLKTIKLDSTAEGKTPEVVIDIDLKDVPTNTFTLRNGGGQQRVLLEKIELDY